MFCYGVLQHTPNPAAAFSAIVSFVKPGGHLAIDVYTHPPVLTRFWGKYLWRPITTRLPTRVLRRVIEFYVPM